MGAQTISFYFIAAERRLGRQQAPAELRSMAAILLHPSVRIGETGNDMWAPADSRDLDPRPTVYKRLTHWSRLPVSGSEGGSGLRGREN
jgi:hypothetical protein